MKIERHFMDINPKVSTNVTQAETNFESVLSTTEQLQVSNIEQQPSSNEVNERSERSEKAENSESLENTETKEEKEVNETQEQSEPAYYGQGIYDYTYKPVLNYDIPSEDGLIYKAIVTEESKLKVVEETVASVETVVSEALGVTEEEAKVLLEKAELPVENYEKAITEHSYQSKIVQVYYNAEEAAELLTIVDAPQVLSKLSQAVQQNYLNTQVEEVLTEETAIQVETTVIEEIDVEVEQGESQLNSEAESDLEQIVDAPIRNFVASTVDLESPVLPTKSTQVLDQSILDQVKGQIKLTELGAGTTEIRMTLTPETLGEVSMRISTQNGVITAQFVAASQRVKEILESNFNQLKEELNEKGIQVGELSVSVQQDQTSDAQKAFEQEQQKNSTRINQIIDNIVDELEEPLILEQGSTISVTA